MSKNKEVFDKVKKIIVDHLGSEESKITESASFIDDLDPKGPHECFI